MKEIDACTGEKSKNFYSIDDILKDPWFTQDPKTVAKACRERERERERESLNVIEFKTTFVLHISLSTEFK